jgi:hypothetical protein
MANSLISGIDSELGSSVCTSITSNMTGEDQKSILPMPNLNPDSMGNIQAQTPKGVKMINLDHLEMAKDQEVTRFLEPGGKGIWIFTNI